MKILFVFGTRPEAIKMAPLVKAFRAESEFFETKVCITSQHREMLDQVLHFFEVEADYDLDLMTPNQSLYTLTSKAIAGLEGVVRDFQPDLILVQGDTTTAFVGALAGFYGQIDVGHIEAGLRSGKKYSPFPEELNRILAGHLSALHFAPTQQAKDNLAAENIVENVHVVGNSVVDALFTGLHLIRERGDDKYLDHFSFADFSKRIVLVTGHRRESFGKPFQDMCNALKEIATSGENVEIIYPVHLNPNVQKTVKSVLGNVPGIHLIPPLDYEELIWLMNKAHLVLTDSGGIQEEAPSLGKPVLVMREVTERVEGIEAGTAKLVGTDREKIVSEAMRLLTRPEEYRRMSTTANPYGDGETSRRVIDIVKEHYGLSAAH